MMSNISEKSLEINVNENLVNLIRSWGGAFAKCFIYGFSLREEAHHGFDSSINVPRSSIFLFSLQYKKPKSKHGAYYRFEINTNGIQHLLLLISSLIYENVYYAFPLFINTFELSSHSPNFLNNTCFVNIRDFPSHTFDGNIHIVEINSQSYSGYVFSEEKANVKVYPGKEFLKLIKEKVTLRRVSDIKRRRLLWTQVYEELKSLGIEKEVIDSIKEKRKKLYIKFTSGFFSER